MKDTTHYLYKITNTVNDKIYYGVHKHKNPHKNSYMGGGVLVKHAQDKHGIKNFTKEVVRVFNTEKEKLAEEKRLVTSEFVAMDNNYNCAVGGIKWHNTDHASEKKQQTIIEIEALKNTDTRTPEQIWEAKRKVIELI